MSDRDAIEEQARAYLEFTREGQRPRLGSPWEIVQDAIAKEPEHAWCVIVSAVGLSEDDSELALIGTGPLENLLVGHAEYLERAMQLAAADLKFRRALRSADIRGGAADSDRLDAFFEHIDSEPS